MNQGMDSEASSAERSSGMAAYFRALAAARGVHGPIGELSRLLSASVLDPTEYARTCVDHGVGREPWFRRQVLDLMLGYVARALEDGPLSSETQRDLNELRRFLHIQDG